MRDVSAILRKSEQGVSCPYFCRDAEGAEFCCKGILSGMGTLRAEWMCANLAQALGLPVPPFEILNVPYGLFSVWRTDHPTSTEAFVTAGSTFVFASRMVPRVKDVLDAAALADSCASDDELAHILLFDRLIHNTDRCDGNSNLLVEVAHPRRCYIIDHSNAFGAGYTPDEFMQSHILRHAHARATATARAAWKARMDEIVTEARIDDIWERMPEAWKDEAVYAQTTLSEMKDILLGGGGDE